MAALDTFLLTMALLFFVPLAIIIGNVLCRQLTWLTPRNIVNALGIQKAKVNPTVALTRSMN